jgi:curved DNA-binding protein CbpA
MSSSPDIDPYVALGVAKDATISEIRAAHRKRVLKCHPDKIQDISQRNAAQDEFQRVQQAYELLSDDTRRERYDQKVRLVELKRQLAERKRQEAMNSPRGSGSSREMRGGHFVEERVPVDVFLDEELRYTEEPRTMSRKDSEFRRPKAKPAEDKKKARAPPTSYRAAKDDRETAKATQANKAKQRDRDRRSQASAKYDVYESYGPRVVSVSDMSDSSDSDTYVPRRRPTATRRTTRDSYESREPRESRSRPTESSSRRRERIYEDEEDYFDRFTSPYKHEALHSQAEQHIQRSRNEVPRTSRSPQRPRGYEPTEPESSASRRSGRSSRPTRDQSSSRHNSYEHLESSRSYDFKVPKIPTTATSPAHKASMRPSLNMFARAATASAAGFTRAKREGSSREEPSLEKMVREQIREPRETREPRERESREREPISRSSKGYDSGYSSPSTPKIPQRGASPRTTTTRYKIDEPVVIEPSSKSKYRSTSPERPRGTPKRSSTYQYTSEASPRVELRTVRPSRNHGDVEYSQRFRNDDVKFAREIRPENVRSSQYADTYARQPPLRRQSTAV